jgi:glutamyl-tRNA reductase
VRILLTGLSHNTAPIAVRERVGLTREQLPEALSALKAHTGRGVIVSTCNRMEVYTLARDAAQGRAAVDAFLADAFGLEPGEQGLYRRDHDEAVRHLFRVAASLDSQILGESEILGQVRDAFGVASRQGMAGGALAHLFHSALRTGKRARTETAIGRNALSVSRACVEITRSALDDLRNRKALVIGVGEASRLAAQALRDAGIGELVVVNRTYAHAVELAQEMGGTVASLEDLPRLLAEAHVAVTATAAPDYVLSHAMVADAAATRAGRPLLLMDIAVPRDVEPTVADIKGVHLYSVDDLEAVAESNRRERAAEAVRAERIVEEELARFHTWWQARGMAPTISAMRAQAEEMREAEVARTLARMQGLTVENAERIEAMTKALVKKLLHSPTHALRTRNDESFTQAARELFGLDER